MYQVRLSDEAQKAYGSLQTSDLKKVNRGLGNHRTSPYLFPRPHNSPKGTAIRQVSVHGFGLEDRIYVFKDRQCRKCRGDLEEKRRHLWMMRLPASPGALSSSPDPVTPGRGFPFVVAPRPLAGSRAGTRRPVLGRDEIPPGALCRLPDQARASGSLAKANSGSTHPRSFSKTISRMSGDLSF